MLLSIDCPLARKRGPLVCRLILVAAGAFGFDASSLAAPPCANARVASIPVIAPADMAAIDRAVVFLPAVGTKAIIVDVGTVVPRAVETKPLPGAVRKVLPHYAGYKAFRTGLTIVIVHPTTRRVSYLLPLRRGSAPAGCVS